MIPMLLWVLCLLMASALAYRCITQGGPFGDWIWVCAGSMSMLVFGGALWAAVPQLWDAIAAESILEPRPVFKSEVVFCVAVVFFRPHRRKAATQ